MSEFKHKVGDVVKVHPGRFGEIRNIKVVYDIFFGPDDIVPTEESDILTEPKPKRTRRTKEEKKDDDLHA